MFQPCYDPKEFKKVVEQFKKREGIITADSESLESNGTITEAESSTSPTADSKPSEELTFEQFLTLCKTATDLEILLALEEKLNEKNTKELTGEESQREAELKIALYENLNRLSLTITITDTEKTEKTETKPTTSAATKNPAFFAYDSVPRSSAKTESHKHSMINSSFVYDNTAEDKQHCGCPKFPCTVM
ncbi:MAG: hypothetical protein A3C44_02410 [Gammaproteobacteria bacterium RIFCSPHIGHO2_02_FULL_39_13]|nr:MAG: hypothetical protein A3C44_02410 [Gammaproteobacteria bacterium RIFCSPHIGHO2_02_FULL_39_13]OGT50121.1 MAG: hypothetical protein A3E53_01715 [Gammaproteobacteria bacterium RIFCSPHIGHO2_12_FULL_39_24]